MEQNDKKKILQRLVESKKRKKNTADFSLLLFKLENDLLALEINNCKIISKVNKVFPVPNISRNVLDGLVNIQGETVLCFDLSSLLLDRKFSKKQMTDKSRIIIIEKNGITWAFFAHKILGLHYFNKKDIKKADELYFNGILNYENQIVKYINDELLFCNLSRRGFA